MPFKQDDNGPWIAALDAWRRAPVRALRQAIFTLGERRARERPPLELGEAKGGMKVAWATRAAARDPDDLALLATPIVDRRFGAPTPWIEALAQWPTDPRISEIAREVIVTWKHSRSSKRDEVLRACLSLLERYRFEPETADALISWRDEGAGAFKPLGREAHKLLSAMKLERPPRPDLTDELQALITRLLEPPELPKRADSLSSLWSAVYQNPELDAPLRALAEALRAQGDPRGRFIALQLARAPGSRPSKEERALLKEHERAWMGPWADALATSGNAWRRGLLVEINTIKPLRGDEPQLAAVEVMHISRGPSSRGAPALTPSRTPRLRHITGAFAGDLAKHAHPGLTSIEVVGTEAQVLEWIPKAAKAYPAVRALSMQREIWAPTRLAQLLRSRFGRQLERVDFATNSVEHYMNRGLGAWADLAQETGTTLCVVDARYTKDRNIRGWHAILTPEGTATLRNTGRSPDTVDLRRLLKAASARGLTIVVEGPKKLIQDPLDVPVEVTWRVAER